MTSWEGKAPPDNACGEAVFALIWRSITLTAYHNRKIINIQIFLWWHL
jgi:hypothetical protein